MFKLKHAALIYISGTIWLAVGLMLLSISINLFAESFQLPSEAAHTLLPLASLLAPYSGGIQIALFLLIAFGIVLGYFKGKFVLEKSALKGVERICAFPNPTPLNRIYSAKYYILLILMIGLGVSIKYFGLSRDIRGFVDMAIGIALLTGSLVYYRQAALLNAPHKRKG